MYLNVVVKLKMLSHGHYKVVKPGRKYYVYNTTCLFQERPDREVECPVYANHGCYSEVLPTKLKN